jgi:2-methylcitrate dehydratase PrpD
MSVASELAKFAIDSSYDDLPPLAIDYAEMLIASTVSSAALGSTLQSAQIIRDVEFERGGKPEATVWFSGGRLPAIGAARVNAVMSDASASDDSDLRNIVHQGTTACAAALALGESLHASGKDILSAIVLGYEVAGRFSSGLLWGYKTKGFHGGLIASFAGAVAAARLLKLSPNETAHAISLTATSGCGLMAASNTSIAREYHAGLGIVHGVQAAQAAAKGFKIEETVLEKKQGFFAVYGDNADVDAVTKDFGKQWNILENLGIKLVSGGHPQHSVAEAAAQAAREGDVHPEDVDSIEVSRPGFQGFANMPNPTDLGGMAQSAIYFAAAGVADREFTWEHATEAKISDPRIRGLLPKVKMGPPPTENLERYRAGAVVTIRTRAGRSFSATVFAPKGAAILGISWQDVEAKYRRLFPYAGLSSENLERSFEVIKAFRSVADPAELTKFLG